MPRRPIVQVDNLVKRYQKSSVDALGGVSLEVDEGQFFALLGPNGAGKTTLLSILTTTLAPTAGHASVDGHDLAREPDAIRRKVGIIFQQPSLDLNLTAEENVRFHAVMYGLFPFRPTFRLMPAAYRDLVRDLASVLGLEREVFRPVKTFSGGMKRKLEIIRSLVHRPKIMFLDEPTTGLDAGSRRDLWRHLGQVRSEHNTTVFLTTHYLEEAEQADAICIINKGQVVSYGSPEAIKAELVREELLVDADDRPALLAELETLGLSHVENDLVHVELGLHTAYDVVKRLHTPLTVLRTSTPTLEDAYLQIVAQEAEA